MKYLIALALYSGVASLLVFPIRAFPNSGWAFFYGFVVVVALLHLCRWAYKDNDD